MQKTAIFHLAFPVRDLKESRHFYDFLGAKTGRVRDGWVDIFLFGAQITLHERPEQVFTPSMHGVRHFGGVVSWGDWEDLATRLTAKGMVFKSQPAVTAVGSANEQAKFLIADPSGNLVEIKAYRDPAAALESDDLSICNNF